MQNRFASFLVAALLPLLLFRWFVPTPVGQIDFWLMWVVAMILVGLPLLYAEIGLAHRSQKTPALGMQTLTRQADTSPIWRNFVWVSVLVALIVVALNVDAVSDILISAIKDMGFDLNLPAFALAIGMVVVAGILSLLGLTTLLVAVLLMVVAFIIAAVSNMAELTFMMTKASLAEWARAAVLALVSVGIGTGLYWFNSPLAASRNPFDESDQPKKVKTIATKTVLPIWLTQLVIGSVVLMFTTDISSSPIAILAYSIGILVSSAFLMHYASSQIATRLGRFGIWIATAVSMVLTIVLVLATPQILTVVLVVTSIFAALTLAIFSGWKMKISHMRKSLNFSSEAIYNLWRIAVRILAPLLIIVAVIGWFA